MESPTDSFRRGDSVGDSVTSLYDYLSLNPSVIPSVKSSEKNSTSTCRCIFPDKLYTPSEKRSVYTNGNISSVYIDRFSDGVRSSVYTDRCWDKIISVGNYYRRKIPSRIPLIFSGFLVVTNRQVSKQIECLIKSIEAYCGFDWANQPWFAWSCWPPQYYCGK